MTENVTVFDYHHLIFRKGKSVGEILGLVFFLGPLSRKGGPGPIKCHYLELHASGL